MLSAPDYTPSEEDVLLCRSRTIGIVKTVLEIDKNEFNIYDVGGQRNERRKWIHCFDEVTAVIFVAALSEYDQVRPCSYRGVRADTTPTANSQCQGRYFSRDHNGSGRGIACLIGSHYVG